MITEKLSELFQNTPQYILQNNFSMNELIQNIYNAYIDEQPLITDQMDEDQIWSQLNASLIKTATQIQSSTLRIERKAEKLAENDQGEEIEEVQEVKKIKKTKIVKVPEILEESPIIRKNGVKKIVKVKPTLNKQTMKEEMQELNDFEKYYDELDNKKNNGEYEDDEDDEDDEDGDDEDGEEDGEDVDEDDDQGFENADNQQIDDFQDDYDDMNNQEVEEEEDLEEEEVENEVFDDMRDIELEQGEPELEDEEIDQLQKKLLATKEWQMGGEISSRQRPLNSLLEENLDFKTNNTQAALGLMTTKEYQSALEAFINKRIQDECWDDRTKVQFSQVLQDTFGSNKQALDLNKNKSQFGLGEIFEQEFKNALGIQSNTTEQQLKIEIFRLFRDVSYKLDNLSNLKFETRGFQKSGEIKITHSSGIQNEEMVPLTYTKDVVALPSKQERGSTTFLSKDEAQPEELQKGRRQLKSKLRNKFREKKQKDLIKSLNTKGQTKFEHNQAAKSKKYLQELSSQVKQKESIKFDKSSKFFSNLQNAVDNKSKDNGGIKLKISKK